MKIDNKENIKNDNERSLCEKKMIFKDKSKDYKKNSKTTVDLVMSVSNSDKSKGFQCPHCDKV